MDPAATSPRLTSKQRRAHGLHGPLRIRNHGGLAWLYLRRRVVASLVSIPCKSRERMGDVQLWRWLGSWSRPRQQVQSGGSPTPATACHIDASKPHGMGMSTLKLISPPRRDLQHFTWVSGLDKTTSHARSFFANRQTTSERQPVVQRSVGSPHLSRKPAGLFVHAVTVGNNPYTYIAT